MRASLFEEVPATRKIVGGEYHTKRSCAVLAVSPEHNGCVTLAFESLNAPKSQFFTASDLRELSAVLLELASVLERA